MDAEQVFEGSADYEDIPKSGPFVRSAYNYDMDFASEASGLYCLDVTRTQQQFKEETDINTIVRRFGLTGEMPQDFRMPSSGDFTNLVTDFHTAANMMTESLEEFMTLPADMRARFYNDPQNLLTFIEDPANKDEAIRLGLIDKPVVVVPPEPINVRVIPEPSTVTT